MKSIENAKQQIVTLLGKFVSVKLNKGRNKIIHYNGIVSEVYNNVFVISVDGVPNKISCSYTDVLCGEVSVKEKIKCNNK